MYGKKSKHSILNRKIPQLKLILQFFSSNVSLNLALSMQQVGEGAVGVEGL
jgi:hypothetical protein